MCGRSTPEGGIPEIRCDGVFPCLLAAARWGGVGIWFLRTERGSDHLDEDEDEDDKLIKFFFFFDLAGESVSSLLPALNFLFFNN